MKLCKKLLAAVIAAAMLCCCFAGVSAESSRAEVPEGYDFNVYMDFEAFTLGWGFIAEPFAVPANEGENVAQVTLRALETLGLECSYGGTAEEGFYLKGIEHAEGEPNVPAYLMEQMLAYPAWAEENMGYSFGEWTGAASGDGMLGEYDYSGFAGWMFAIDDVSASVGADGVTVEDGAMYRWMFSVYGWGMDCGLNDGWGMFPAFDNPAEGVVRSEVMKQYVELAADSFIAPKYEEGGAAYEAKTAFIDTVGNIASSQEEIDAAFAALFDASYDFDVYVDFEAFTLGWGFILEPVAVPANEGENIAMVTVRALDMAGIAYNHSGKVTGAFYLKGVGCDETLPNVPEELMDEILAYPAWSEELYDYSFGEWTGAYTDDGLLSEQEYSTFAGWMFAVNDALGDTGADGIAVAEGSIYRWMFSIYGWGMDIGMSDGWGMFPDYNNEALETARAESLCGYAELANDPELAAMMAEGGEAHEAYVAFMDAMCDLDTTQEELDAAYAALLGALHKLMGDVDLNGEITGNDALTLMRYALSLITLTDEQLALADFNGDGAVNALDALLIMRSAMGLL